MISLCLFTVSCGPSIYTGAFFIARSAQFML